MNLTLTCHISFVGTPKDWWRMLEICQESLWQDGGQVDDDASSFPFWKILRGSLWSLAIAITITVLHFIHLGKIMSFHLKHTKLQTNNKALLMALRVRN